MDVVRTGESSLRVMLHPLPILNISEHLTRVSLQLRDPNVRVVGGLLGTQAGREIEIMNTFEIVVNEENGELKVDHGYFITRKEQFKQVFPTFDFLGWYSIGEKPTSEDTTLHQQFLEYNESPLFVQMSRENITKSLPVVIYESAVEMINNEVGVLFTKTDYEIETGEAERVAVDHASKPSTMGSGAQSSLIANLITQKNATKMLHDRIATIVQYLEAVIGGTAIRDHETLRQISALVTSLSENDSKEYKDEFMTEYNDVLLTNYLAAITTQLHSANSLLDKQLFLTAESERSVQGPSGRGGHRSGKGDRFFGPPL